MKETLMAMLLISSLCSFKKDETQPAVPAGSVTAIASLGYPKMAWLEFDHEKGAPVLYIVGAEYQENRWLNTGLQYCLNYSAVGMQPIKNYFSGTVYQLERWAWWETVMATADFCYLNKGRVSLSAGIGLGLQFEKISGHVIDSVGISTSSTHHERNIAARLRLINAKVRVAKNFGLYGGLGLGYDGMVAVGAYYTFLGKKARKR
jgi:hypothetical protein